MSLLSRLLGNDGQDRDRLRPLWHRIVEITREPVWYSTGGIADTVPGRFDVITLVLSIVLLRMERDGDLKEPMARLTELFVDDMDGQLRQNGIGDMVVGKHIGRLVSTLGGRLGAYRTALANADSAELEAALERNVTFGEHADPNVIAALTRNLSTRCAALDAGQILAGAIAR